MTLYLLLAAWVATLFYYFQPVAEPPPVRPFRPGPDGHPAELESYMIQNQLLCSSALDMGNPISHIAFRFVGDGHFVHYINVQRVQGIGVAMVVPEFLTHCPQGVASDLRGISITKGYEHLVEFPLVRTPRFGAVVATYQDGVTQQQHVNRTIRDESVYCIQKYVDYFGRDRFGCPL